MSSNRNKLKEQKQKEQSEVQKLIKKDFDFLESLNIKIKKNEPVYAKLQKIFLMVDAETFYKTHISKFWNEQTNVLTRGVNVETICDLYLSEMEIKKKVIWLLLDAEIIFTNILIRTTNYNKQKKIQFSQKIYFFESKISEQEQNEILMIYKSFKTVKEFIAALKVASKLRNLVAHNNFIFGEIHIEGETFFLTKMVCLIDNLLINRRYLANVYQTIVDNFVKKSNEIEKKIIWEHFVKWSFIS